MFFQCVAVLCWLIAARSKKQDEGECFNSLIKKILAIQFIKSNKCNSSFNHSFHLSSYVVKDLR